MAAPFQIPQGLSATSLRSIPQEWDPNWFRRWVTAHLQNVDIRNTNAAGGVTITGVETAPGTVSVNGVALSVIAPIPPNTIVGNNTGVTAHPIALTGAQTVALLPVFTNAANGVVPGSGGGTTKFLRADQTFVTAVQSVGLSDGSSAPIFGISATPVTTSGTLVMTLNTQAANLVFAGPISGAAVQPTFRALVAADIPFPGGFTGFATPTGKVELAASAGAATTAIRSDANIQLDQTISPTWTGNHSFTPTAGLALQITNVAGQDGIVVTINQAAGLGWMLNATGSSSADVRGILITNSLASTTAGNFGLVIANDGTHTMTFGKTSTIFAGSRFSGSPAGEICWLQSGGAVPISFIVGAPAAEAMGISGTGNVRVNAPTAGVALAVSGLNNSQAQTLVGGVTASQSFGLKITAGTNASDTALDVLDSGSARRMTVWGDGGVTLGAAIDQGPDVINVNGSHNVNGIVTGNETVTSSGTITTVETYLSNALSLPANSAKAGSGFRITLLGNGTSTVANTVHFNVRLGAAGTTADAAIGILTLAAATTGSGAGFRVEAYVTFRTIGATGTVECVTMINDTNGVGISSSPVIVIDSGSSVVNTTGALKLGISGVTAAGTTSFQIVQSFIERLF